jgi:hypothetical protein
MTSKLMNYVAASALAAVFAVSVATTATAAPVVGHAFQGHAFQPQVQSTVPAPALKNAYWIWRHHHHIWVRPHHYHH